MPESVEAIEAKSWTSDDAVPDYVREFIEEAIDSGAVFDRIESAVEEAGETFHNVREQLEGILRDNLTDSSGWSLEGVTDDIQESFPNMSEGEAETVARSETASVLNEAREEGYDEQPDSARFKFKWVGPDDSRTTPACEELKELTNPDHGGTPVDMNALKRYEEQVHGRHFTDLEYREHMLHPNERHTFRRVLPHELQRIEGAGAVKSLDDLALPDLSEVEEVHTGEGSYVEVVEKMGAVVGKRSSREAEIEEALGDHLPRVVRSLLGENDGRKRPALRALNERLDDAGMSADVSPNTFYGWIDKYRLNDEIRLN